MRFSVWPNPTQSWSDLLEIVRHADATGWHGVWFADHFMPNAEQPDPGDTVECWTTLAALAASTERVRLGPLVSGNTYRHPAVLANQAAAVDVISGGRLVLGLGAGWQINEHQAYGIEFSTLKGRMDRFEEACQVVLGLLREERTTFDGKHYQLADAPCAPKPVGPVPLLLGGGGEQRTLRIAARYADEWNVWSTPEVMAHKASVLAERCAEVDRDPATIVHSTQALVFLSEDEAYLSRFHDQDTGRPMVVGTPGEVVEIMGRYRDAGVDEFIVPDFTLGTGDRRRDTLDLFREQVAPALA